MLKRMFQLTALLTLLFLYSQERIHAQTMETTNVQHYGTGFDQYDPQHMELRTGTNGDMFNCIWEPDNIAFHNGMMSLKIDSDGHGGYTGGEWRTREYFGYGFYQVSMKPIANPGVVTSFFTYTGPSDGTRWDEIDIEFLGKDTTKVQFNYFTDGVGNHEHLFDLGFDASKEFHTYGFEWQKEHITWYVDGKAVYTASENIPITPGKIMMNAWPGIGVDHWLDAFDGKTPLYGYYDWMSYDNSKHEEQISFDGKKSYKIISQNSGQALDVVWGDKQNGTNVLQYPYGSYPNQQWHIKPTTDGYFILENSATGKVLSVEKEQASAGSNVYQWEYNYQPNQEWKIIPAQDNLYKVANRQSGLLLNVAYASREQNANVEVYPDVDSPAQKWWIDLAD